jgi:tetratricopeptide (TPR) repeat protein
MKILSIAVTAVILIFSFSLTCADSFSEPSWVYKGLGDRFFKNGELGEAIVSYKKALIARTKETEEKGEVNGYPEVNIQLAKIYLEEELYDIALKHLETAEKQKELLQIPDLDYEILYTKAELFNNRGNSILSSDIYKEIINRDHKGKSYFIKYDREGQFVFTEDYIDNPEQKMKFGKAYFAIAKIKYDSSNFENAIPYLKMTLLYKYNPKETLNYLYNCYKNLNNEIMAKKVVEIYKKII